MRFFILTYTALQRVMSLNEGADGHRRSYVCFSLNDSTLVLIVSSKLNSD